MSVNTVKFVVVTMTSCYSNAHAHVVATTHGTTFSTVRLTFSLAGQPVVVRQIAGPLNTYNYLYTDHLGSVVSMSSSSGVVTSGSRARFYPFGDWRTEPTQTMTDRGFTGHRSNNKGAGDMGLIYMNARYYLPGVGRFVSADSLVPDPANPQSFNRYSYVLNSPLNFTDPTGHFCVVQRGGSQLCSIDDDMSIIVPTPPPLISLQEWEMQLIAMVAFYETSGLPEHRELVIWTIINRINSPAFSDSAEELLVGTQYHISLRAPDSEGVYQEGIFAAYKDPGRAGGVLSGQALSDAAFAYYSSRNPGLTEVMNMVQGIVNAFNQGGPDPTRGAVYFAHGPDQDWAITTATRLEEQAEIDGLGNDLAVTMESGSSYIVLNNIYDPPFGKYPFSDGYCTVYAISICEFYLGQ